MSDKGNILDELYVKCDLEHPCCKHGPTLLFQRRKIKDKLIFEEYYACSAYRNLNGCNFYLKKSDYDAGIGRGKDIQYSTKTRALKDFELDWIKDMRQQVFRKPGDKRFICHTCNALYKTNLLWDHEGHDIQIGISDYMLRHPTYCLRPQSDNKAEAQYFFTENTVHFFINLFKDLKISKICCIGAPRIHEKLNYLYNDYGIESYLLDIDHRYFNFYDDNQFAWFNMFNGYFFEGDEKRKIFEKFLKIKSGETMLLFIDPPFGCRTEPLVNTIKEITSMYNCINPLENALCVMWIFPYYMGQYIEKYMPELQMMDYKVNYSNHIQYTNPEDNVKARKYGSPVRIFTNIPANLIKLPENEGYKLCDKCMKWTYNDNKHCDKCKECTSKNGAPYKHCDLCAKCVKITYKHCIECGRCLYRPSIFEYCENENDERITEDFLHLCSNYQKRLNCWICKRHGHGEINCQDWYKYSKIHFNKTHRNLFDKFKCSIIFKEQRMCLICTKVGDHNEKKCPKRKYFLKEKYFLSEFKNIFNIDK